ncbi:MAG: hypothetical protein ISS72_05910 [Candidatus Brocadiae bacterium]|nr:hypothetical protein [Candidatus Brocadiia bacterium]
MFMPVKAMGASLLGRLRRRKNKGEVISWVIVIVVGAILAVVGVKLFKTELGTFVPQIFTWLRDAFTQHA